MKKITIEGMSCMNCVRHVKEIILKIPGVTHVEISLERKTAEITGEFQMEKVIEGLKEEDYIVKE